MQVNGLVKSMHMVFVEWHLGRLSRSEGIRSKVANPKLKAE